MTPEKKELEGVDDCGLWIPALCRIVNGSSMLLVALPDSTKVRQGAVLIL